MTSFHVYTVTLLCLFLGRYADAATGVNESVTFRFDLTTYPFNTTRYAAFLFGATNLDIRVAAQLLFFLCLADLSALPQLRNVLLELMVGKAEDIGNDVADIVGVNMSVSSRGIEWGYNVPAAIPAGDYHIRVTGAMHNISGLEDDGWLESRLGPPLGNYTVRSQTFPVVQDHPFACTTPKWTPIPSVDDPRFSALLIYGPRGGEVYFLKTLKDGGSLYVSFTILNEFIRSGDVGPVTLEIVNTATGASVRAQTMSVFDYSSFLRFEDVRNMTVGAWKVRANYTLPNVAGAGPVSEHTTWSDEFYIASAPPCGGLFIGNSTTPEPGAATRGVRASFAAVLAFAAALVTVWMTSY
ncbi:hypothetical protein C8J57DRAFT_1311795 [Mycena rebaudengoi]|nr:hypothetical protein C8J57DRAFT_1311795 [Mycena rebaudengoi]